MISRIFFQQNWQVLSARLPKNVSHLCVGVGADDHLYIVGDVVAKLDLKTETWKDLVPF
jgi:hypothetical protein